MTNAMKVSKLPWIVYQYLTDFSYRFRINAHFGMYNGLSDEEYLKRLYFATMGHELDLNSPETFNEKLQWLKLYDRRPEYTMMVDKYLVRDYIAKTLGEEYLIPLLGVWDDPDEIDFDALPNQFVLKCNHNSGLGMCICKDKSGLDIKKVKAELRKGLAQDYYLTGREWPYKDVPRKIICEKFMSDKDSEELTDFKFYCFNGSAKFLYISKNLADHDLATMIYLNLDFQATPFQRTDYKRMDLIPQKPDNFDMMRKFADKLSQNCPFVRVDFYNISGKIYFGELTFFPGSGMQDFTPDQWNYTLGSWLELPTKE